MKRRQFIAKSLAVVASVPFVHALSSCGSKSSSGDSTPSTGGNCLSNGTSITIASNHGHTLTVSAADITAGVEKTYNIQGSADHNHTVTLTASDFTKLKANTGISETSSTASSHTHLIEVGCA